MEEEYFISVFNEGYPFERYIFKEPVKINALFDDLFLTELFIPSTEIKPILDSTGDLMGFTEIPLNEIYVKVKGKFGEARLSFFDFADDIREEIRYSLIMDFGQYEWESLYVQGDDDDDEMLKDAIEGQRVLIEKKYGVCNIKENISLNNEEEDQP